MDLVEALKPDLNKYYDDLEAVVVGEQLTHLVQVLPPNISLV